MASSKKRRKDPKALEKAAKMRDAKAKKVKKAHSTNDDNDNGPDLTETPSLRNVDGDDDSEVCTWPGGVENHEAPVNSGVLNLMLDDSDIEELGAEEFYGEVEKNYERVEEELERAAAAQTKVKALCPVAPKPKPNVQDILKVAGSKKKDEKKWKDAEKKLRAGVNTGNSERTQRLHRQMASDKEVSDALIRAGPQASMMRTFLAPKPPKPTPEPIYVPSDDENEEPMKAGEAAGDDEDIFTGYLSDKELPSDHESDNESIIFSRSDRAMLESLPTSESTQATSAVSSSSSHLVTIPCLPPPRAVFHTPTPPPLPKRRKLEVPARKQREIDREKRKKEILAAYMDIAKTVKSKKTVFQAGRHSLQERRARAIESTLQMVVKRNMKLMPASAAAALSHGLSAGYGARLVRYWVREWIKSRALPESNRGNHAKLYSLLTDPDIRDEMRSFLRSNKWAVDPGKFQAFMNNQLLPEKAEEYAKTITEVEMPKALQKYLAREILPRHGVTLRRGISYSTARELIIREGFSYTQHKKALYYDGHERPDNIDYRQNKFIPRYFELVPRLVEFVVGDVEKEKEKDLAPGEKRIVLVAHDEMTAQCHDAKSWSWVQDGEQPLRKKGAGRGIHQSDVICACHGWLPGASQTLEYGKDHEGFWNAQLFVGQLKDRIMPDIEDKHPGMQACILVDNSQGHSSYAIDALVVNRMNMRPGGAQARMRDGWYIRNGQRIAQSMVFPSDHPTFPNQPKGMKAVLEERGLLRRGLLMKCKDRGCHGKQCCAHRILENQPDFQAQRSLVQETIEDAGHICLFLPKYHCELNPIEYFWGAVKRHLRERCDYTFPTLKINMPIALQSVEIKTIRKWFHRIHRWIEAYRDGLDAKGAQKRVRDFSSRRYKSHRRVVEGAARTFDV